VFLHQKVSENSKEEIRERILTLLRNQEEEQRLKKSLRIGDKLFKMQEFHNATTILFYASFDGEVNTLEMIKKAKKLGKTIGLPRINKEKKEIIPTLCEYSVDDLENGPYGIKEPRAKGARLKEIDVVIVPGVAFDQHKNRLGRGGGYYDRFLKSLPQDTPTIGLAFDFQIVEHLPCDTHDVCVSHLIVN
jgi:5-formyltetrahydrofolate cyclo-ligase